MPIPLLVGAGVSLLRGLHIGGSSDAKSHDIQSNWIAEREAAGDVITLQRLADGGIVSVPPWMNFNWGDGQHEETRQRAREAIDRIRAHAAPQPAPVTQVTGAQRVIDAALNAGQLEIAAQVGNQAEQARVQAQARTAGGLLGSLSPTQMLLGVLAVIVVLVLLFRRRG